MHFNFLLNIKQRYLRMGLALSSLFFLQPVTQASAQHLLKVSDNQRYLVRENNQPFFYLGDTAWELFHRLNREEADRYLKHRADKGLRVIQA